MAEEESLDAIQRDIRKLLSSLNLSASTGVVAPAATASTALSSTAPVEQKRAAVTIATTNGAVEHSPLNSSLESKADDGAAQAEAAQPDQSSSSSSAAPIESPYVLPDPKIALPKSLHAFVPPQQPVLSPDLLRIRSATSQPEASAAAAAPALGPSAFAAPSAAPAAATLNGGALPRLSDQLAQAGFLARADAEANSSNRLESLLYEPPSPEPATANELSEQRSPHDSATSIPTGDEDAPNPLEGLFSRGSVAIHYTLRCQE